jgi:hypothetical protein
MCALYPWQTSTSQAVARSSAITSRTAARTFGKSFASSAVANPLARASSRNAAARPPSGKDANVVRTGSGSARASPSICRSGPPKKVLDVR